MSVQVKLDRLGGGDTSIYVRSTPNIDPKCNALVPVTLCHVCIPIAPEMRAEFAWRHAYPPSPARRRCRRGLLFVYTDASVPDQLRPLRDFGFNPRCKVRRRVG